MVKRIKSFISVFLVCVIMLSFAGVSVNADEADLYTIRFVDENGTELQSSGWEYGETPSYSGETPTKEADDWYSYEFKGWTPEITEVTGNATYTAVYNSTLIEYIARFVDENGETVAEITYTIETETKKITPPPVPEKEGFDGEWYPNIKYYGTFDPGGMTFTPIYDSLMAIWLDEWSYKNEIGYKESQKLEADGRYIPKDAEIHWFVNGEDVGTGWEYTVEKPTENYTVIVKVLDKNGNVIARSPLPVNVTVRNGFFDKIQWFFETIFDFPFKIIAAIINWLP